jgi:FAD/FMN-containing dehydrogenase
MGQFALGLVAKHFPQLRVPFWQEHPWCVVLENSDNESEAHARECFERLLEAAMEAGCATDAVVAESMAQAHALWHIRESIPMAQAEEGLNIKHDISINVSRIPEFCAETNALLRRAFSRRARMVVFGHLGDGNLHYNVQAPENEDQARFLQRAGGAHECAGLRSGDRYSGLDLGRARRRQRSRLIRCPSTSRRWRWA